MTQQSLDLTKWSFLVCFLEEKEKKKVSCLHTSVLQTDNDRKRDRRKVIFHVLVSF